MDVHDQSAVGESEMRAEGLVHLMGGQDGMEFSLLEEQERIVLEPIGMVIHIVAVKEKRSVSGFCHIRIPLLAIFGGVFDDFKHDVVRI